MMQAPQSYYLSDMMHTRNDDDDPWENHITNVVDLRKVVYEELESTEKSFESAQRTLYEIQLRIKAARTKLEATEGGYEGSSIINWDEEAELTRLRKEVRTLKNSIPYSLLYPSPPDPFTVNPNVVWYPRSRVFHPDQAIEIRPTIGCSDGNPRILDSCPPLEELRQSLNILYGCCMRILNCMSCFPENAIIKRSLLVNCYCSSSILPSIYYQVTEEFDNALRKVIALGFLKAIQKRSTLLVSSYLMPSPAYHLLRSHPWWTDNFIDISPSSPFVRDIFYSEPKRFPDMKSMKILLLGKWRRLMPIRRHFEVANPNVFFKGMEKLTKLKYISLRDISMITELPQFITKLEELEILDCKACHDLEKIPNNINKLWRTLTHLDVSECYFLDHLPRTLSDLIHLQVLKGFWVTEPIPYRSCTISDLSTKLSKLKKLLIYTSVKEFPNTDQLEDLQRFQFLRKLTICWRGSTHRDSVGGGKDQQQHLFSSFNLEKLDLQCVPETVTRVWLNPRVFNGLKKLYIRGGKFFDLGQYMDGEPPEEMISDGWTVEVLRLKYLSKLKMDKSEVDCLFPKLIRLEKVNCPNLTSFPGDEGPPFPSQQ